MVFDLRPIQRGEVNSLKIDYELLIDSPKGIEFVSKANVKGDVKDNAGYITLHIDVDVPYKGECARCLKEVCGTFSCPIDRTVVSEGVLSEEKLEENVDEYVIVKKGMLEIDELISEEITLTFPQKLLCKEDCKGICPKCGKDLNLFSCSCTTKEIDPRLEVLKKLLDKH